MSDFYSFSVTTALVQIHRETINDIPTVGVLLAHFVTLIRRMQEKCDCNDEV